MPTGRASHLAATTQIPLRDINGLGVLSRVSLRPRPGGIAGQIDRLRAQGVDLVLIDTPPTATPAVNAALDSSTGAIVVTRPNPEDLESVQESLRVAGAQKRLVGVILWQSPPDKRVRAVSMAREALDAMKAEVCPTAISASISYPYAYAEALTPQEREPEGRARAELAEVWGWIQRIGLMASVPYDSATKLPDDNMAVASSGRRAARPKVIAALRSRDSEIVS